MDTNKLTTIEDGMLEAVSGGTFGCGAGILGNILGAVGGALNCGLSLLGGLLGGLCGGRGDHGGRHTRGCR